MVPLGRTTSPRKRFHPEHRVRAGVPVVGLVPFVDRSPRLVELRPPVPIRAEKIEAGVGVGREGRPAVAFAPLLEQPPMRLRVLKHRLVDLVVPPAQGQADSSRGSGPGAQCGAAERR